METIGLCLLTAAPGLALVAGMPRYKARLIGGILVGVVGWLLLVLASPPWPGYFWAGLGLWSLSGSLYSLQSAAGEEKRISAAAKTLEEKRKDREALERQLAEIRRHGSQGEEDQKRALTVYGLVKGLSEALSWDSVRPRLEAAMRRYLELEEFALYLSELDSPETMHPLVKRGLAGAVGGSWGTLKEWLIHRQLDLHKAHLFDLPQKAMGVPIHHGGELAGYVFAKLPPGIPAEEMLNKAQGFAEEISFALRRICLFQEVERLSELDGLTGVYRRGVLEKKIQEETLRARAFKTTYCLMLLDIDHFKRLNDAYGHPFGDSVLKRVGEILRLCVYETDFVARYGGEEFAVLLPRAEPAGVLKKADLIRSTVEREAFVHGLEAVRVTLSAGVAHFPRDAQTPEEMVAQADQALYQAKARGRNCVVDGGA